MQTEATGGSWRGQRPVDRDALGWSWDRVGAGQGRRWRLENMQLLSVFCAGLDPWGISPSDFLFAGVGGVRFCDRGSSARGEGRPKHPTHKVYQKHGSQTWSIGTEANFVLFCSFSICEAKKHSPP